MLTFVCLLAVAAVATGVPAPVHHHNENLQELQFTTRVNHFTPQDGRTVNFTYTQNVQHFEEDTDSPIFIYVGDGGHFTTEWLVRGHMFDIAADLKAALVTADHRYYGQNIPMPTASFDDLQFLTVDQALADLAILIDHVRENLRTSGLVILWGTGYGGALAANARKKFPHLVDGVWASSAYFRAEDIDWSYYDNLSSILAERGGETCASRINAAFFAIEGLIEGAEADYLQERLRLCDPLDVKNPQEVGIVIYRFISMIADYLRVNQLPGLERFCDSMNAIPEDPLNSLVRWIQYAYGGRPECVTVKYETLVGFVSETNWTRLTAQAAKDRVTNYLECTQLGGLRVTSDFELDLFPSDLITPEYRFQFCRDQFGPQYNSSSLAAAVEQLNLRYGGQDQVITHVVFTNAGLDPLIHHGVANHDLAESAVFFLQNNAAGADLRSLTDDDSRDLFDAKLEIREHITRWTTG